MKLYQNPLSSNARKAVMTSLLLELPVELVLVDLAAGAQRKPEYLQLNPNGKVPTLVDGELVLWESLAILIYLAEKKADTTLYPKGLAARADVHRWLFWAAGHFTPTVSILNFENMIKPMFNMGAPDAARVKLAEAELTTLAKTLDTHLANRAWVCGDAMTLADVALACPLMTTQRAKLPLQSFANLQRWYAKVQQLDAWKQTEPPTR
jgi:glutathione S-transferase